MLQEYLAGSGKDLRPFLRVVAGSLVVGFRRLFPRPRHCHISSARSAGPRAAPPLSPSDAIPDLAHDIKTKSACNIHQNYL
jgi:hypothetical protein